jgi:hypothetical protein
VYRALEAAWARGTNCEDQMSKEHRYVLGKCDYNGSGRRNCKAVITWSIEDGRFSMCAEIWNPRGTDIYCGGQCVDTVAAYFPNNKKAARMVAIWRRWHLNDMKAGTPAQEAWLRDHPMQFTYPQSHYEEASKALAAAGLNPDNGYSYGSKWLCEEIPADIRAEIEAW